MVQIFEVMVSPTCLDHGTMALGRSRARSHAPGEPPAFPPRRPCPLSRKQPWAPLTPLAAPCVAPSWSPPTDSRQTAVANATRRVLAQNAAARHRAAGWRARVLQLASASHALVATPPCSPSPLATYKKASTQPPRARRRPPWPPPWSSAVHSLPPPSKHP